MGSLHQVLTQINGVLLGKHDQVRLAVACLVAGGHLLIEDFPGVGKTTLAEALARSFGLAFRRVHFTSDLLPADLTGLRLFDQHLGQFRFEPGPLFSQVLLADEINRASPRCQSALLEAMAAGRVSVDGTSHQLPKPFCVIATQNGLDQAGTSPLPESQLDRFAMRLSLGFPPRQAEAALLAGQSTPLANLAAVIEPEGLDELQQQASRLACEPALIDYVLDLLAASRQGAWPRARPSRPGPAVPWWQRPGPGPCSKAAAMWFLPMSRPCSHRWRNTGSMAAGRSRSPGATAANCSPPSRRSVRWLAP